MRLTEKEILKSLQCSDDRFAPLKIDRLEEEFPLQPGSGVYKADAIIEFSIQGGPAFEALIEVVPVATPRNILDKVGRLLEYIRVVRNEKSDLIPAIISPFVNVRQAEILAAKGVSWLDLSGNMTIHGPNGTYIERIGRSNLYPDTVPIKKIFQGKSAIVSRALLLNPQGFSSLNRIVYFIKKRNASVTLSTISKILKSLEEELLITKKEKCIYVTNPEKLLERLAEGYRDSNERKRRKSYRFSVDNIERLFPEFEGRPNIDYLKCGFYAAQTRGLAITDRMTIFVRRMEPVKRMMKLGQVGITPDIEFGNLSIIETYDPGVWFNAQIRPLNPVVDDIELYLEMTIDTPRGLKIAEKLKRRILEKWEQ